MQHLDTKETYEARKEAQKGIWLSKVLAHSTDNEEQVIKEALEKFKREYPLFVEYKWDEKSNTFYKNTQLENGFISEPITAEEYYKNQDW